MPLRFVYFLLFLFILISSCQRKPKEETLLRYLCEDIEQSCTTTNRTLQMVLDDIAEKKNDPLNFYRADIWFQKAELVNRLTQKLYLELGELKTEPASGSTAGNRRGVNVKLNKHLKEYVDSVLGVDLKIRRQFAVEFIDSIPGERYFPSLWDRFKLLDNAADYERSIILTQLQLCVALRACSILRFCNAQIATSCGFQSFSAIVGQNSQGLFPGEKLEIEAGIGAFSMAAQPRITINGELQPMGENGTAKYSYIPKGKPGTYHIPVVIDFIDEFGKRQTIEKKVGFRLLKKTP